jgi:hyperosmotically inducible protein
MNKVLLLIAAAAMAVSPVWADDIDANKVRRELVTLPFYGIYDHLTFRIDGGTVILSGQAFRPTTKSGAENVVKRVAGVEKVVNNIEVLPLSPNDDRIRIAVTRAVYGNTVLNRYALGAVPAIHIVVKNGNVTLEGLVNNDMERSVANIAANGVAGVFGVTNNLRTERPAKVS